MATDDQQILVTGQADAPASFRIPGNGQVRPKSIFASFDGTGAAGAFLPALKVISDGGETVGIYPADTSVAAGASADVSWFPHLAAAASGATGANSAWFFAKRETNQSIPSGASRKIGWVVHETSDSSVFSVTSGTVTNDTVKGLKAGIYVAQMTMAWTTPQTYPRSGHIITDFFGGQGLSHSPATDSTTDQTATNTFYQLGDVQVLIPSFVPGEISVLATNYDGSNHNVTACYFSILYLSNSSFTT